MRGLQVGLEVEVKRAAEPSAQAATPCTVAPAVQVEVEEEAEWIAGVDGKT